MAVSSLTNSTRVESRDCGRPRDSGNVPIEERYVSKRWSRRPDSMKSPSGARWFIGECPRANRGLSSFGIEKSSDLSRRVARRQQRLGRSEQVRFSSQEMTCVIVGTCDDRRFRRVRFGGSRGWTCERPLRTGSDAALSFWSVKNRVVRECRVRILGGGGDDVNSCSIPSVTTTTARS
jgi:hypothetical protein